MNIAIGKDTAAHIATLFGRYALCMRWASPATFISASFIRDNNVRWAIRAYKKSQTRNGLIIGISSIVAYAIIFYDFQNGLILLFNNALLLFRQNGAGFMDAIMPSVFNFGRYDMLVMSCHLYLLAVYKRLYFPGFDRQTILAFLGQ